MIEFTWVDLIIALVFALSTAIGIYRGVIREMLTIVIWTIAFILAITHGETAGELFTFAENETAKKIFGMIMIFASVLIAGLIVKFFAFRSFGIGKPNGFDRSLGAAFGVLRAIAIVALGLTFIAPTKFEDQEAFKDSKLAPKFQDMVDFLSIKIPPKWQHKKADNTESPKNADGSAADAAAPAVEPQAPAVEPQAPAVAPLAPVQDMNSTGN